MTVGKNLGKLRKQTKFSQQDIANHLGIDRNTYANWENETSDIKSEYIPKIADVFGVDIKELFEASTKPINLNQNITESTVNNAINGAVIILTDKEDVEKVLNVIKNA